MTSADFSWWCYMLYSLATPCCVVFSGFKFCTYFELFCPLPCISESSKHTFPNHFWLHLSSGWVRPSVLLFLVVSVPQMAPICQWCCPARHKESSASSARSAAAGCTVLKTPAQRHPTSGCQAVQMRGGTKAWASSRIMILEHPGPREKQRLSVRKWMLSLVLPCQASW